MGLYCECYRGYRMICLYFLGRDGLPPPPVRRQQKLSFRLHDLAETNYVLVHRYATKN